MKPDKAFWTHAKAAKLLDQSHSCCERIQSTRLIPLMPRFIGKWKEGIKAILDMDLGKYTECLNGVLLGYNNMKVSRTCLPMEDQPFMHLNVQFDAIIFKPVIGSKLKCTVNEVAPDHIGCLAHNYFNVSISLPMNSSITSDPRLAWLPGIELEVEINKIHSMHGIIAIKGNLPSTFDSILANLQPLVENEEEPVISDGLESPASISIVTTPTKKRKRKQSPQPIPVSSSDLDSSLDVSSSSKKKKKKKHKRKEEDVPVKMELGSDEDELNTHGHDDVDLGPSKGITPHTSGKKDSGKKKKKHSVSSGQFGSPFVKQEEQSLDDSVSEFNNMSDFLTPTSSSKKKKKKNSLESNCSSIDLDVDVQVKAEPLSSPKSAKKKKQKRSSNIADSNRIVQMKAESEDGLEAESSLSKSAKKKKSKRSIESNTTRRDLNSNEKVKAELVNGLAQKLLVSKSPKKKRRSSNGLDNGIPVKTELEDGLVIKQEGISLHKQLKDKKHKHRKSHGGK